MLQNGHNDIDSLIHLIDDPNEDIYLQIKDKILSYGRKAIPSLEFSWETKDFGELFQTRIEDIIHEINLSDSRNRLTTWFEKGAENLIEAAIIIAKYQYPSINEDAIIEHINLIKQDIWVELNEHYTAFEQIKIFNEIFFSLHGFKGNKTDYHAPENSYINKVLETHKGNPLLLGLIQIYLAKELNIPLYGVNLPNHFILAYIDKSDILKQIQIATPESNILFYVNPFNKGMLFQKSEIDLFLKQLDLKPKESYYSPCGNVEIIQRLVNNLISSYEKLNAQDKVDDLISLRDCLE